MAAVSVKRSNRKDPTHNNPAIAVLARESCINNFMASGSKKRYSVQTKGKY